MGAGVGQVGDDVADLVSDTVGGCLVHDKFVSAHRGAPVLERDTLEAGVADVGVAERGATSGGNELAVLVKDLRESNQRGFDHRDALDVGQLVGDRRVDRVAFTVSFERLGAAHLEVDVADELVEEPAERGPHAVGKHE